MDAITAARQLGKAIQQDERYTRLIQAQERNDADEGLQKIIGDFNVLRNQLNAEVQNPDKDTDKIKAMDTEIKELYAEIFRNKNMVEFSEAREDLQEMLTFVNQIITGSASGQNPDAIEYQQDCGGDCGGCSGCS